MSVRGALSVRPGRPAVGFGLLVALIALFAAAKVIVYDTLDPDCFWHLRVGQQLLRDGIHPLSDTLSFASLREPWTPYSWLAEVGMFKLWQLGGLRAVIGVTALIEAAFVLLLALCCQEAVGGLAADAPEQPRLLATVLSTAVATVLSLAYLSFRPVTLAIVLLAACAWLMLRDRRMAERSRGVWLIVPLTALAVNVHLFALLVPVMVAALLAGAVCERLQLFDRADVPEAARCVRRYQALLGLTVLACLATPMLPGVLRTARHYALTDPMVHSPVIAEMQPLFGRGGMGLIWLVVAAFVFACIYINHNNLRLGEKAWLLLFALPLLRMGRFAPLTAVIAAPALAVTLPRLSDRLLGRPLLAGVLAAVLGLGLFRVATDFPSRSTDVSAWLNRHGPDTPGYPSCAADFVAQNVAVRHGRLINEFSWGGYLAWRLGDQYQVLLDGRTQLYSPQFWRATYLNGEPQRRRLLEGVTADAAVLPATGSIFRASLVNLGWTSVHKDDRAEVLVPPAKFSGDVADLRDPAAD